MRLDVTTRACHPFGRGGAPGESRHFGKRNVDLARVEREPRTRQALIGGG